MPSADDYAKTAHRYVELIAKGKADDIADLFTDTATIEDPVGTDIRTGREAIHEFYAMIENLDRESELVTLKVAGNEAAFLFRLTLTLGDKRSRIEGIDAMVFDDDAKITSMRAYWSPTDLTQL